MTVAFVAPPRLGGELVRFEIARAFRGTEKRGMLTLPRPKVAGVSKNDCEVAVQRLRFQEPAALRSPVRRTVISARTLAGPVPMVTFASQGEFLRKITSKSEELLKATDLRTGSALLTSGEAFQSGCCSQLVLIVEPVSHPPVIPTVRTSQTFGRFVSEPPETFTNNEPAIGLKLVPLFWSIT